MADMQDVSYLCMENGCDFMEEYKVQEGSIDSFAKFIKYLDEIFILHQCKLQRHKAILALMQNIDLSTTEINKYTFFDYEKPYTRNLVYTDGKNYSLLLLCWTPAKESKIHNHPCDYCFVKSLRGTVRETKYTVHDESKEIRLKSTKFFCEGQISYMNDDVGLHKIGNPNKDSGAVSLHLYTPPFLSCKVWSSDGVNVLDKWEDGKIGFFSVMGHRSPHLEGKPGNHFKLMNEIKTAVLRVSPKKSIENQSIFEGNWENESKTDSNNASETAN